ncbi:MAG: T9SS type A sorting domain-containing protein, partial [Bacteroidales bacterium]|nr:T9SS type A sorting domain-containing protein [Bacteroidales bacterium]
WIDNLSFIYGTVGIEGITFGNDYRIYADADSRQLIIESSFEKTKSIELSLFNMNGQCMIRKKAVMGMGKEFLDTNKLSKGAYILRMSEGNKIIDSRKITLL